MYSYNHTSLWTPSYIHALSMAQLNVKGYMWKVPGQSLLGYSSIVLKLNHNSWARCYLEPSYWPSLHYMHISSIVLKVKLGCTSTLFWTLSWQILVTSSDEYTFHHWYTACFYVTLLSYCHSDIAVTLLEVLNTPWETPGSVHCKTCKSLFALLFK